MAPTTRRLTITYYDEDETYLEREYSTDVDLYDALMKVAEDVEEIEHNIDSKEEPEDE
jgi:hypothetical protein